MNNNSSKQVLLSVIGVAILVVAVVGVSFAFFNYSRTGTEVNGLTVGTINFTGDVSGIQLDNAFPVAASTVTNITESTEDVAVITVTIEGYTTYTNGIDFSVTAVAEQGNDLPANLVTSQVTFSGLDAVTNKQTVDTLNGTGTTTLVSGNIPEKTQVNGTITIKLFVDSDKVFITDTPNDAGTKPLIQGKEHVVSTSVWNAKSFSFKINIWAVQGGGPAAPAA